MIPTIIMITATIIGLINLPQQQKYLVIIGWLVYIPLRLWYLNWVQEERIRK